MKLYSYIVSIAATIFFVGCVPQGLQKSTTINKKFAFEIPKVSLKDQNAINQYVNEDPQLNNLLRNECNIRLIPNISSRTKGLSLPLITAGAKIIYDMSMDQKISDMEKLKKASEVSYSAKDFYKNNVFRDGNCAILYRYNENNNTVGMLSVLKIKDYGRKAFTFSPIYSKLEDTVALTTKDDPRANITFAIAIKAIGKNKDTNMPELTTVGTGSVTVNNIKIGKDQNASCLDGCSSSDLVVYPPAGAKPISLTFAVTESGHTGIDFDEQISQLKTIKEAMGPAIKEAIATHLKED